MRLLLTCLLVCIITQYAFAQSHLLDKQVYKYFQECLNENENSFILLAEQSGDSRKYHLIQSDHIGSFSDSSHFKMKPDPRLFSILINQLLLGQLGMKIKPLSELMPELRLPKRMQKKLFLEDLIWHTSGLPEYEGHVKSRKELVRVLNNLKHVNISGDYLYSDLNEYLFQYIVEEHFKKDYLQLCNEIVKKKIGMKSSSLNSDSLCRNDYLWTNLQDLMQYQSNMFHVNHQGELLLSGSLKDSLITNCQRFGFEKINCAVNRIFWHQYTTGNLKLILAGNPDRNKSIAIVSNLSSPLTVAAISRLDIKLPDTCFYYFENDSPGILGVFEKENYDKITVYRKQGIIWMNSNGYTSALIPCGKSEYFDLRDGSRVLFTNIDKPGPTVISLDGEIQATKIKD